jgi:hypothetical protein
MTMDKYLEGTWDEFEQWIRFTVGSDFIWKVEPIDRLSSRQMVATDILRSLKYNDGVLPENNPFITIKNN